MLKAASRGWEGYDLQLRLLRAALAEWKRLASLAWGHGAYRAERRVRLVGILGRYEVEGLRRDLEASSAKPTILNILCWISLAHARILFYSIASRIWRHVSA